MITSREQYRFVEIPEGIRVDGGIMPARDVAGDGSWRHLRGEDVAFLMEAVRERRAAVGADVEHAALDRRLDYRRMRKIVGDVHGLATLEGLDDRGRFCRPLPAELVSGPDILPPVDLSEGDLAGMLGLTIPSLSSREDDFEYMGVLSADALRRIFFDLAGMRFFARSCSASFNPAFVDDPDRWRSWGAYYSLDDFEHEIHGPTENAMDTELPFESDRLFEYRLWDFGDADPDLLHSFSRLTKPVAGRCQIAGPFSASGYVSNAVVFAELQLVYDGPIDGDPKVYTGLVRVPSTLSGRFVDITIGSLRSAAEAYVSHHGISFIPFGAPIPPERTVNSQSVEVILKKFHAIFELSDHTDFSQLQWAWTPTGQDGGTT